MNRYPYAIVLEPDADGGFVVHVPAFPEICTEGDTEAEAIAMAKDAIELVIASRLERGEELPVSHGRPIVRDVVAEVA
jgi:antitoxin HicB